MDKNIERICNMEENIPTVEDIKKVRNLIRVNTCLLALAVTPPGMMVIANGGYICIIILAIYIFKRQKTIKMKPKVNYFLILAVIFTFIMNVIWVLTFLHPYNKSDFRLVTTIDNVFFFSLVGAWICYIIAFTAHIIMLIQLNKQIHLKEKHD